MNNLNISAFRLAIPADTYSGPIAVRVYTLPARSDGVVFSAPRFSAVIAGGQSGLEQGQIFASLVEMSSTDPGNVNLLLNMTTASVVLSAAAYVTILLIDHGANAPATIQPL